MNHVNGIFAGAFTIAALMTPLVLSSVLSAATDTIPSEVI
jgi:hypothetical protein